MNTTTITNIDTHKNAALRALFDLANATLPKSMLPSLSEIYKEFRYAILMALDSAIPQEKKEFSFTVKTDTFKNFSKLLVFSLSRVDDVDLALLALRAFMEICPDQRDLIREIVIAHNTSNETDFNLN